MPHIKFIDKILERSRCRITNTDVNAYGTLVSVHEDGEQYPVICGHGGSMWLCQDCKDIILLMQENQEIKSYAIFYLMIEIQKMKKTLGRNGLSCSCISGEERPFQISLRLAEFEKAVEVLKQHEINERGDHDGQKNSNNAGKV